MNTHNLRFRSNKVGDIAGLFHEELDGMYGGGEVRVFLEMLFEAWLGWDRVRLMTSRERTIDQSDLLRFHWALEDLKRSRPIQHIIGYTDFCGCRIAVGPAVLIPRPETEEIVQWIIGTQASSLRQTAGWKPAYRILDLCTGSGCIAIALKKAWPQAAVTAVDVSEAALEVARRNAEANGVDVDFRQADVLDGANGLNGRYGLIVSNPPYVCESERAQMAPNVLDYDPALALFVPDDDPLRFYRAIADVAKEHLEADGSLVVEINEALAAETCEVIKNRAGLIPTLFSDFRGRDRWIVATSSPLDRGR